MKVYFLLGVFSLVLLSACKSKQASEQQLIYHTNTLDFQQDSGKVEIINADFPFVYPIQMQCTDSMIIVLDLMSPDYFFNVFNLHGKWIGHFGRKGKGPGELLAPQQFFITQPAVVSVFSNQKLVQYNLRNFRSDKTIPFQEMGLPIIDAFQVIPWTSDNYLLFGANPMQRIRIYDASSDSVIYSYNRFPQLFSSPDPELEAAVFAYGPRLYIKPDLTQFVQTTYIGAILEIFNCTSSEVESTEVIGIYRPEYKQLPVGGVHITWDEHTTIGFESAATTDQYIYTLLNGVKGSELQKSTPETPFTTKISVFDWAGKPVRQIETKHMLTTIAVGDKHGNIFATSYNRGEFNLIKITE